MLPRWSPTLYRVLRDQPIQRVLCAIYNRPHSNHAGARRIVFLTEKTLSTRLCIVPVLDLFFHNTCPNNGHPGHHPIHFGLDQVAVTVMFKVEFRCGQNVQGPHFFHPVAKSISYYLWLSKHEGKGKIHWLSFHYNYLLLIAFSLGAIN